MTSSEVPIASGIVNPSASTSAGTMTKPPPTPKNPVRSPTERAGERHLDHVAGSTAKAVGGAWPRLRPPAERAATVPARRRRRVFDAPHAIGGDEHQPGEGEQQHVRIGGLVPVGAEGGAGDADETEQRPAANGRGAGPRVGDDADRGQ